MKGGGGGGGWVGQDGPHVVVDACLFHTASRGAPFSAPVSIPVYMYATLGRYVYEWRTKIQGRCY
jgi:hypothetical protein